MTTADHAAAQAAGAAQPIALPYRNWRGVFAVRSIVPIRLLFGANEWHPEPQWLLEAWDADRSAVRTFALSGIGASLLDPAIGKVAEAARDWLTERVPRDLGEKRLTLALATAYPEDFQAKEACACDDREGCDECPTLAQVHASLADLRREVEAADSARIAAEGGTR